MHMQANVVALSERAENCGLLFNGTLDVNTVDEPLADATIRELRVRGVELRDGDVLFFPRAAKGYRLSYIAGSTTLRR